MFSIFKHLLLISFAVSILCEDWEFTPDNIKEFKKMCASTKSINHFPKLSKALNIMKDCMKGAEGTESCVITPFVGSNPKEMANSENCEKNTRIFLEVIHCYSKAKEAKKYAGCFIGSILVTFAVKPPK
ncbi:uncharacterized protein LOC141851802 [Brevipalpus obovatus]|uniref:uncharacterized protein LOC141851802 n=1 Tax=Brevipalpus obovatus TaxID=246614 RepID=UPI003D9F3D70